MTLRVYNTLSKQKELFQTVKPGEVGMYVCGPTVYKPPHMGHLVGPVIFDAVKRYLQYKGFKVTWIVNITDVDDKLIVEAASQKTTVRQIAERCTRDYLDVLALLGIDTIDRFPKASEHIGEIITLIEKLISKGHAYAADGNVWFAVGTDADYGKLSHRNTEEQESGTRDLEGAGKRSGADFALWKTAKPGEPMWESPWGKGRPGWHIECSAMSMKYLGESFDLHGGGMDLLFPHHENELAQSESASDKQFVKYWMHNGLTRIATKTAGGDVKLEKQSKSLGNVIDARELIIQHGADFVRYLILSTHYRSPIDFSQEVMTATKKGQQKFQRLFDRLERLTGKPIPEKGDDMDSASAALLGTPHAPFAKSVSALKLKFVEAMDDDFNTAGAIAALHEMAGEVNAFIERNDIEKTKVPDLLAAAAAGAQSVKNLGAVLGLFNARLASAAGASAGQNDPLPAQLMQLVIGLRAELRKAKNFALADQLRKDLTAIGITLEDRADGTVCAGNSPYDRTIMLIHDLGRLSYRDAWAVQERAHEEVLAGGEQRIYFVEHPPVITYGRRPGVDRNLVASPEQLAALGIEIVQSDRGGDITFHGPGQLVAYPIIRLADHKLSVGGYVHALEAAVVAMLAGLQIPARADPAAVGVWTDDAGIPAKICAFGVRIRRGVSLHGLALNVSTDLSYFNLIIPCGLAGRPVTSLQKLLGERSPTMAGAKAMLGKHLLAGL